MPLQMDKLGRVRSGVDAAIDRGVRRAAGYVLDLAQQLCPVASGDLKASGRVDPPGDGVGKYRVVFGGAKAPYARFVEYGTYASPAQPFLLPAAREIKASIEVDAELKKLVGS